MLAESKTTEPARTGATVSVLPQRTEQGRPADARTEPKPDPGPDPTPGARIDPPATSPAVPAPTGPTKPRLGDKAIRKPAATGGRGGLRRFMLMVVVPLAIAAGGGWWYMQGGRLIDTDNAYVGAPKVLITPSVSGRVIRVSVVEGQTVKAGDPLLVIDPASYQIAVADAEAHLGLVRTEFAGLKANLEAIGRQIDVAQQTIELRRTAVERKTSLAGNRVVAATDVDAAQIDLANARAALEALKQQRDGILAQLQGDPTLDVTQYPAYRVAAAALDKARLDLASTTIRAPIDGMATQVSAIQLGRWLASGTAVFALIGTNPIWVDANPKETDLENVTVGQPVSVTVDTFPHVTFKAHVAAISPGTGAQFSILPAQNAAGNWVKVVQRIPIRVEFEPGQDLSRLRSGMSSNIAIDTGRVRTAQTVLGPQLAGWLGLAPSP